MKKLFLSITTALFCIPLFVGCQSQDYTAHVSDIRSDIFIAETENFTVTLSCVSREYPFLSDGIASPRSDLVEIVLTSSQNLDEVCVYVLGDTEWGGDMSFRNVTGDYYYSRGVDSFPQNSVSLRVTTGELSTELTATSVKTEQTISCDTALSYALEYEKDTVQSLTQNNLFQGELYVRLLRRDKNYYYVGIVDKNGRTVSLLLDSETGALLARRVTE